MSLTAAAYSLQVGRGHNIGWYGIDRKFVAIHRPCKGEGCGDCLHQGVLPLTRKQAISTWGSYTIETLEGQQNDRCWCQHLRRHHDQKGCVQCACPAFVGNDEP